MIPFKLEYVIEAVIAQQQTEHKRVLKRLSGVKLSTAEAASVWPRILDHKWYLSERLGRDVGLRVAAVDYFENIQSPRQIRASRGRPLPRLPFMRPLSAIGN
jgi:transitional endoplasmic reticulum ATPase